MTLGLRGCDVIGVAQTGSVKNDAFVLPMLSYVAQMSQVVGVLDAMPLTNLKTENVDEEEQKVYTTTHMFNATMPASRGAAGQ